MKKILLAGVVFFMIVSSNVYADWTGEIKWINVKENGSAYIFIDNPREPSETFNCGAYNVVHLGAIGQPVNSSLLALAMTVYTTGKTIRFNTIGTGDSCRLNYISARWVLFKKTKKM